ncbi:hypothetical protein KR032_003060 [Drosophila birchii]|nr:hypothetical protein KR032_003060 [Drosophila birchii]
MTTTSLPRVPEGLRDLMKVYTKEVLREKPPDLYEFSAKFFNLIVAEKSHQFVRKYEPVQTYETIMKNRIKQQVPISMVFNIIPETLTDLIKKFIKAVLREKPENIYIFAQEYFQRLSKEKSGRIEYTKYSTYEKSIKDKENIAPSSKVTCECGRVLSAQSKDLEKAVSTETAKVATTITEQTTLTNSISYIQSVVIIQRNFRRYLKQKKIGREKNKCNSVEYMTAIILIQRQFRRVLAKRRVEKLKKSRPGQLSYVKFNAANYMKAVVVIQRHYRIYLKRKQEQNRLKYGPVSLATAAIIIQRAFRRMVSVRRARRTASVTADPGEDLNDNASETGSYTSVSTALLSTESTELGIANYEEKVHQKIIHEDEEVENNNVDASLEKEYFAEPIKSDDKSIDPRKQGNQEIQEENELIQTTDAEKPVEIEDKFTAIKAGEKLDFSPETELKSRNASLDIQQETEDKQQTKKASIEELQLEVKDDPKDSIHKDQEPQIEVKAKTEADIEDPVKSEDEGNSLPNAIEGTENNNVKELVSKDISQQEEGKEQHDKENNIQIKENISSDQLINSENQDSSSKQEIEAFLSTMEKISIENAKSGSKKSSFEAINPDEAELVINKLDQEENSVEKPQQVMSRAASEGILEDQDSSSKQEIEASPLAKEKISIEDAESSSKTSSFEAINPDEAELGINKPDQEENSVEKPQQVMSRAASEALPEMNNNKKEEVTTNEEITDLIDAETGEITRNQMKIPLKPSLRIQLLIVKPKKKNLRPRKPKIENKIPPLKIQLVSWLLKNLRSSTSYINIYIHIAQTSIEKSLTSGPAQPEVITGKNSSLLVTNQLIGTQNLPTNRNEIEKNTKKLSSASVKDKDIGTLASGRLVPTPIAELQLKSFKAPNDDGAWYDIYVEPQVPPSKDLENPPPAATLSPDRTERDQDIPPETEPTVVAERVPSYYTPKEIVEPKTPKAKNSISFFVSFDSDDGKPKYKIPKKFRDQSKSNSLAEKKKDSEPEYNDEDIEVIEVSEGDPEYQQMGGSKLQTIVELNENEFNNENSPIHPEVKDIIDKEQSFIKSKDLKLENSTKTDTEHYESIRFSSAQGPYLNGNQLQEVVEEPCIKRSASLVSLSEGETGNDSSKSEATGLDTLSADTIDKATVKLSKPEEVIEKMAQLRESRSSERNLSAEASFDEPIVRPMSSMQEQASLDIEDGDIIVYNRLQRDETRESSAQSDSVVFGEAESDKNLDKELATEEESGRVHLMRHYTIAGDDPRGLFRSVTIDDALSYGELGEKDLDSSLGINSTNSFYLDDETSENIRKKMMAYSLSETDSDYFDPKKMSKEDFDIDTAMADAMGTSTETESTIVSAATKIQAGARGFLTRRRLRRASAGTKSSTMDTKASFGNDAISESLERFIEEEAAKKIQAAYRIHTRKRKGKTRPMEGISLESNLAARRQKLQRGDALRNDSTPDDENSGSTNTAMELKWLTMRQNSMPVQIDCEVFRVIPKHMRKRIKSAEAGKRK